MSFFNNVESLTIDGKTVAKLELNNVVLWEAIKNWVKYSTEADGITIYNNGLGYKNGYRVRSGGTETSSSYATCTGFIPCRAGDVIRMYSPLTGAWENLSSINVADLNYENFGQIATNGLYGVFSGTEYTWVNLVSNENGGKKIIIPTGISRAEDIAFIRVTLGATTTATGESFVITINEKKEDFETVALNNVVNVGDDVLQNSIVSTYTRGFLNISGKCNLINFEFSSNAFQIFIKNVLINKKMNTDGIALNIYAWISSENDLVGRFKLSSIENKNGGTYLNFITDIDDGYIDLNDYDPRTEFNFTIPASLIAE